MSNVRVWIGGVAALALLGCGSGKEQASNSTPPAGGPAGRPMANAPFAGMADDGGPSDDNPIPIKLTGVSSVTELAAGKAAATSPEAAALFESGFRKTYTTDKSKRDYAGAQQDLERAIAMDPTLAQAYRALGYARFNQGFNTQAAFENYQKAVQLKPDYGEAWYALAFMYAQADRQKGAEAFKKAMSLGVPDERKLGERFYPGS